MELGLGLGHEGEEEGRLKIAEKLDTATPLTISIAVLTCDMKTSNSLGGFDSFTFKKSARN